MSNIYVVYPLAILITLMCLGIVSLMVKLEMQRKRRVHCFVWLYSMVVFGLVALLWYGIYQGIIDERIIGWW